MRARKELFFMDIIKIKCYWILYLCQYKLHTWWNKIAIFFSLVKKSLTRFKVLNRKQVEQNFREFLWRNNEICIVFLIFKRHLRDVHPLTAVDVYKILWCFKCVLANRVESIYIRCYLTWPKPAYITP